MLSTIAHYTPLKLLEKIEYAILKNPKLAQKILTQDHSNALETISQKKAIHIAQLALDRVPAFETFLADNHHVIRSINSIKDFQTIPLSTKTNFVKKYGYESRCVGGKFPISGNIDESSGSSGKPTNWVRSVHEEDLLLKAVEFEYYYTFKPKHDRTIILSAWSSGPWATGVKFCELMEHFALVKNIGTDIKSIIDTLQTFGPDYEYILGGYPLFLQNLFDENKNFPWKKYTVHLLTGGDSNPPSWHKHFEPYLQEGVKVLSSYGCSDVDIGIGFETPLSQYIRELCIHNTALRHELFKDSSQIPMMFQYNPLMHHIENVEINGMPSFCVTLLDTHTASPKIRYSVEDRGGRLNFNEAMKIVKKHAPAHIKKYLQTEKPLTLPFLFVGGRVDGTLSFDGANVFPEQVAHAIEPLMNTVRNFTMNKRGGDFIINLELKKGAKRIHKKEASNIIAKELASLNHDYAESLENNHLLFPKIEWFTYGTGPFKSSKAIKFKRS